MLDVLIQTYNEELNLPRALASLAGWTHRVFVVDSGSTDKTRQIAESFGATFVTKQWQGYARQKNWALDNLPFESPWVLILDADESVGEPLRREITELLGRPIQNVPACGFFINRLTIFMGREIRHCAYFPAWNLRLFKRGHARYEDREVHEHMQVAGKTDRLKGLLIHEDRRGLEHFIAKHNRYSTLEAMEIYRQRETWPGLSRFLNDRVVRRRFVKYRVAPKLAVPWFLRFVYMYIIKGGILDRRPGLTLCLMISTYELFIRAKYLELIRTGGKDPVGVEALAIAEGKLVTQADQSPLQASDAVAPSFTFAPATDASAKVRRVRMAPSPWTTMDNFKRTLWMLVRAIFFRTSFHNWYAWRRLLLRMFGAKLGRGVRIRPTASIEMPWNLDIADDVIVGDYAILYSLGKITIGRATMISQYAHLCAGTHDYTSRRYPLLCPPIVVGSEAWIAADAFVGPGVSIGDRAVVGARATVVKDVAPDQVVVGPAATPIKTRVLND